MKKLTRKQEVLYGLAGFGPGLLMIIINAYIINAYMIGNIAADKIGNWTFYGATIISTVLFSVLSTIARVIDGVVDVPLASISDRLRTRWGKRRPAIAIALPLCVLTYVAVCTPLMNKADSVGNTVWVGIMVTLLYIVYTMMMVSYYGAISEVTRDQGARMRVTSFKAVFDTIGYALAYAVLPAILGSVNIRWIALAATPLLLTMLIPLFIIKEPSTLKADEEKRATETGVAVKDDRVSLWQSIKITFTNKNFMIWLGVFAFFFFGLQMFLAGQGVLAGGAMGLANWQITVMNTAAFAPIPLMLFLYSKVSKKFGMAIAFRTAILSFIIAMSSFCVAYVEWIPSQTVRLVIGLIGSTIGSYGIGAFFQTPYVIPVQLAAEEHKRTGKNNSAMFFAAQGLLMAAATALSTSLVWINLRDIAPANEPFLGAHIMTYVVIAACVLAFGLSFFLPKYFSEFGKKETIEQEIAEDLAELDGTVAEGEAAQTNEISAVQADTVPETSGQETTETPETP